jgi:rhodanese-related sulfurtransferase
VRNIPEFENGGMAEGSIVLPLPKLPTSVEELKGKEHLVVSCRTGLRARVAYSILIRHGINATVLAESNFYFR